MKSVLFVFSCGILLQSCISLKPLEFKQVDHFTISNVLTNPEIHFEMIFTNPNSFGCTVKEIETDCILKEKNILNYKTKDQIRIKRKGDFTVPVTVNVTLNDLLNTIPDAINLFRNNKAIPYLLSGKITLKKFLFKKTFTFSWKDQYKK